MQFICVCVVFGGFLCGLCVFLCFLFCRFHREISFQEKNAKINNQTSSSNFRQSVLLL